MLVGFIKSIALVDATGKTQQMATAFAKESILSEIIVHEGNLLIADSGKQVIWRLNSELDILGSIELDSKVQTPSSLLKISVVKDQLHVVNARRHRIDKIFRASDGLSLTEIKAGATEAEFKAKWAADNTTDEVDVKAVSGAAPLAAGAPLAPASTETKSLFGS